MARHADRVRENRLRRMAQRQGYRLERSRRRDPRAIDYGGYQLIDIETSGVVFSQPPLEHPADLDDIERFLTTEGA
jgi:hypothetical protein